MPSELKALSEEQAHEIVDKIEKEIRTANWHDRDLKFIFPAGEIADTLRLAWNRRADDPIIKELVGLCIIGRDYFGSYEYEAMMQYWEDMANILSRLEARKDGE